MKIRTMVLRFWSERVSVSYLHFLFKIARFVKQKLHPIQEKTPEGKVATGTVC